MGPICSICTSWHTPHSAAALRHCSHVMLACLSWLSDGRPTSRCTLWSLQEPCQRSRSLALSLIFLTLSFSLSLCSSSLCHSLSICLYLYLCPLLSLCFPYMHKSWPWPLTGLIQCTLCVFTLWKYHKALHVWSARQPHSPQRLLHYKQSHSQYDWIHNASQDRWDTINVW